MKYIIVTVLMIVAVALVLAIPAAFLMFLLWLLSQATGWAFVALNFWACYAIVAILTFFFPRLVVRH